MNLKATIGDGYTYDDEITYDVVVISEVLEIVREPLKLMLNIVKRMRDRTFCIVTIPNGYGPW